MKRFLPTFRYKQKKQVTDNEHIKIDEVIQKTMQILLTVAIGIAVIAPLKLLSILGIYSAKLSILLF